MRKGGIAIDVLVALVAFAIGAAIVAGSSLSDPDVRDPTALTYAVVALYSGTVVLRSRRPLMAALGSLALGFAYAAARWPLALVPVVLLTMYTAATRLAWTASRRLLVAGVIVAALGATFGPGPTDTTYPVLVGAAWLLGHYVRTQRSLAAERARQAVTDERLRIARELHDVVAHTMSVVVVQAGTGRMVALDDPPAAQRALATIETSTRSALVEMRGLLGVLRASSEPEADLSPAPGLRDLDTLVADVSSSGVAVDLHVEGTRPDAVPAGVDLAAYRIVQEALTNVIRHAGAGVRATVVVRYSPQDLSVSVDDDGRGASAPDASPGHGIAGMRERVAMHGGRLDVGRRTDRGFSVTATLPLTPETPS